MISYNEFEVNILEQIKEELSKAEGLKDFVSKRDIFLVDIPEEYENREVLLKLSYIELSEGNYSSNSSKSDVVGVQVDLWKEQPILPLSEGNKIRAVMYGLGFVQVDSFSGYEQKELGKMRDSRRYVRSFKK